MNRADISEKRIQFLTGALIGAVCFICVYGIRILNFSYDDWLFNGDMDLRQHYVGWCHFRSSAWSFPAGLIDSLAYPSRVSVIYSDSIPMFALFFKIFRSFLPLHFQYFGLYGLISFVLTGGIAALLLRHFTKNRIISISGSVFFIMSFTILQRMYYHTALASQWLILLSFYIWLECMENMKERDKFIIWTFMAVLCVSIHSYYLPMVGLIMLAALIEDTLRARSAGQKTPVIAAREILVAISFCLGALLTLYLLGAFYGDLGAASKYADGLGAFEANLNTFINPLNDGNIYGPLKTYGDFQYEGFAYLGGGVILLLGICLISLIIKRLLKETGRGKISLSPRRILLILVFAASCFLSMFPILSFNDVRIIGIPYPVPVKKLLGVFRSNGRLVWPAMYILILASIVTASRIFKEKAACVIIALALIIQIFDISKMAAGKHEQFFKRVSHENMWDSDMLSMMAYGRDGFVFLYNDNDIVMDTAFYAYLKDMTVNSFYFARDVDEEINRNIEENRDDILKGRPDKKKVYIMKKSDTEMSDALSLIENVTVYYDDEHIIAVSSL